MSDLSLSDARRMKTTVEREILRLLTEFQSATHLSPTNIHLVEYRCIDGSITIVDVHLELEF